MSVSTFEEITKTKPERSLLAPLRRSGGRNNQGVVTTRHMGGGHKRRYRIIDFKRDKVGVAGKIVSVEYDPNRSALIALVVYSDGLLDARPELALNDRILAGHLDGAASAREMVGRLMKLTAQQGQQPDDITVLVARCTG